MKILPGNSVPQTIFKFEDVYLLLLNTENLGMWKLNNNFVGANIDREILLQIESGFGVESAM